MECEWPNFAGSVAKEFQLTEQLCDSTCIFQKVCLKTTIPVINYAGLRCGGSELWIRSVITAINKALHMHEKLYHQKLKKKGLVTRGIR